MISDFEVTYETAEDLAREAAIVRIIEKAWDVKFQKFPDQWSLDGALIRNNTTLVGFVEIRTRNCSSMDWPTFMMSASKVKAAKVYEDIGIPVAMVVKFTDGLFVFNPCHPAYYREGGRKNPRMPSDRGEMAFFAMADLKHFSASAKLQYTMPFTPLRAKGIRDT